jgi:hypothetical protein
MYAKYTEEETQQENRQNLLFTHGVDSFRSTTLQPKRTRLPPSDHPTKQASKTLYSVAL